MASDRIGRRFRAVIRRDELHVHDLADRAVHRLAPEDVVRVLDGDRQDHIQILGEEAVESGLRALARDRIGRRAVVTNGALAATTGIFTLWLPGSASAASLDVAAEGTDFASSASLTATNSNGGTLGFITLTGYTGSLLQIVVEATAGGRASNMTLDPGRGRRIAANYDLAALKTAASSLEVTYSSNYGGVQSAGGGGDGGQAIAVTTGSSGGNAIVVMAGAGGGAGLDSPGGDGDATGGSYTNPDGGIITGGAPGSGGPGGASGTQTGTWVGPAEVIDPSGQSYPGAGEPGRPAGVTPWNLEYGSGGGGFGAGGFGARAVENVGGSNVVQSTGGGGGGSFVNTSYRVGYVLAGYSTRSISERCRVTWYYN